MAARGLNVSLWIFIGVIVVLSDIYVAANPLYAINSTTTKILEPHEDNTHKITLTVPVVYYGKAYTELFISKDGLVSFGKAMAYRAQDWSAPDVSSFIDTPFIAPYYFDAFSLEILRDYTGVVTFEEFTTQQIKNSNISEYIQGQVIGSGNFKADWVMQITWFNVTSNKQVQSNRCEGTYRNPCPGNSFQLVLLSDGANSYAIINYGRMEMPQEKNDQAGFNGGHGIGWTNVLTSGGRLSQLNLQQGSDTVGRYIYKISSEKIFRGGCSNDPNHNELSLYPSYAGMFGGKTIDISGPCFSSRDNIMCRFGKQQQGGPVTPVVKAIFVSPTRIRCMVPRLMFRERIMLSVSLRGQNNYNYQAPLTIVFPGRMPSIEHVDTVSAGLSFYEKNPTTLTLSWAFRLLSTDPRALVDIKLIGYREVNGKGEYSPLTTLDTGIQNSRGQYTFMAADYQCVLDQCSNYEIGLITVTLQDQFSPNTYKSLSSRAVPLGWWAQNAMVNKYGDSWPNNLCTDWYNKDSHNTGWSKSLLPCPCSMEQAMADFGRWQPDVSCNLSNDRKQHNCYYHKGAVHCVRAVQPVGGAGNQCCYGHSGQLMFAQDTFQGSTPDRSHDWGAAPYGTARSVPSLSHWLDDVVPFYYCCLWTNYGSCDMYMDQRPTTDCVGYSPPIIASVYGQGHVMPFGGYDKRYRMVGKGDFTLLQAGNTVIQGRFDKNLFNSSSSRLYSLIGVAVQDIGTSDKVELTLRGPQNVKDYQKIDVKVNGHLIHFNDEALAWHDFKSVAVVNTDKLRQEKSNFTVILSNGIGLHVIEIANTLQLDVVVPIDTFDNVSGLFGDLDGTLSIQNGTDININNLKLLSTNLYRKFELNWAVQNKLSSLFQDFSLTKLTQSTQDIVDPSPFPRIPAISGTCGETFRDCVYDYMHTGSVEIARATRKAENRLKHLRESLRPVRSCGLLNVPRASKNNYNYTLGTTTTLTRCRVGSLEGPTTYTCQATSNETQDWFPAVTAVCAEEPEEAGVGLIVGVVIAVVVVVAVIIAVILFMRRKQASKSVSRKRRGDGDDEEQEKMKTAV